MATQLVCDKCSKIVTKLIYVEYIAHGAPHKKELCTGCSEDLDRWLNIRMKFDAQ